VEPASFVDALREIQDLKVSGVVRDYAIAGGMALVFWTEPVPTYDLDVFVLLPPQASGLTSLEAVYDWARAKGFSAAQEHLIVHGVPTQIVPSPNPLCDEAISSAEELEYQGVSLRVVRPEYLVALCLEPSARTPRRRERAALLMELPSLNRERLSDIMKRYALDF
jgi:hypothetical protein